MDFKTYLQKHKASPKSIESHLKNLRSYQAWLDFEGLSPEVIHQKDILSYLQYCKAKGNSNRTLSHVLNSLRKYYQSLEIKNNPCLHLQIKGVGKTLPAHLLTEEELTNLHQNHPEKTLTEKRNKLMLSLLTHQGITTAELINLEIDDLDLIRNFIEIKRSLKGEYRRLLLRKIQVENLKTYLKDDRLKLLQQSNQLTEQLFITTGKSHSKDQLKNTIQKLMKRLKTEHSYFVNARQIRGSRIALWLQEKNLREVQQLAGHRYISSTERYQMGKVEDLQKELDKYHPRS